jgi:hypothetical protein
MQGFDGGDCKERIHLEDLCVDCGMILKQILCDEVGGRVLDLSGSCRNKRRLLNMEMGL